MPNSNSEIKAIKIKQKIQAHDAKSYTLHYQRGEQAAYRGDSIDAMPRFRNANRVAAWLKGHSDARLNMQQQHAALRVDQAGVKRLKDIITQAIEQSENGNPS